MPEQAPTERDRRHLPFSGQAAVRRLIGGSEWCPLADVYGRPVSIACELFRAKAEAAFVLDMPSRDERRAYAARAAAARSKGSHDRDAAERIAAQIGADVVREWEWRKQQAEQAEKSDE